MTPLERDVAATRRANARARILYLRGARALRRAHEAQRRSAWRWRVLASLDAARARAAADGAPLRAWLAATVGERLPLP